VFTCSTRVVVESEARGTASPPLRRRCTRTVARDGESAAAAAARRQPPAARAGTGHPGPHPRRQCCGPHQPSYLFNISYTLMDSFVIHTGCQNNKDLAKLQPAVI
jgi:hypothetical protein